MSSDLKDRYLKLNRNSGHKKNYPKKRKAKLFFG